MVGRAHEELGMFKEKGVLSFLMSRKSRDWGSAVDVGLDEVVAVPGKE